MIDVTSVHFSQMADEYFAITPMCYSGHGVPGRDTGAKPVQPPDRTGDQRRRHAEIRKEVLGASPRRSNSLLRIAGRPSPPAEKLTFRGRRPTAAHYRLPGRPTPLAWAGSRQCGRRVDTKPFDACRGGLSAVR